MSKTMNITSYNSGKESLSRHLSKNSTNKSREHQVLVQQAKIALDCDDLSKKTPGMAGLLDAIAYKTRFLEIGEDEIRARLQRLVNQDSSDLFKARDVQIDKSSLTDLNPKCRDTAIVGPIADMVVDAHLGKVPVPMGFRHSSAMRTLQLVERKPDAKGNGLAVALPFVFTSGQCHCCSTGSWRHIVDNLLTVAGLPDGKIKEVYKNAVTVGDDEFTFQELLEHTLSGDKSVGSGVLLSYLFSSQRSIDETRMFMPVARLFTAKGSKGNKHQRRWSVEWHCLTCWTSLASGLSSHMSAQMHALIRIEDMINLLKSGLGRTPIRKLWNENRASERSNRNKNLANKLNEGAGHGQTPTGYSPLKQHDVRALIAEVESRCDTRGPEAKKVLYWNRQRKQLELKTGKTVQDLKGLLESLENEVTVTQDAVDDLAVLIDSFIIQEEE